MNVFGLTGTDEKIEVEHFSNAAECHVVAKFRGQVYQGTDTDYFAAFCNLREQLEALGVIPICNATSKDVYPSGMSRDMGAGLKAYRLSMKRKTTRDDLLKIFDVTEPLRPATVAQQREYFERWLGTDTTPKPWWKFWR